VHDEPCAASARAAPHGERHDLTGELDGGHVPPGYPVVRPVDSP
jgi:hypothetical protein